MPANGYLNGRAEIWFTKARFGVFYHWGLFTGGGNLQSRDHCIPLRYNSIEDFEEAAGCPERVAFNMVCSAKRLGARYITFTAFHTCGAYAVMYPTKLKGFALHTSMDYVGALARECDREGIRLVLYLPVDHKHWNVGGEWLTPECRTAEGYNALLKAVINELADVYGRLISGFWIDGGHGSDVLEYIHGVMPDAVVIMNNDTGHRTSGTDISATEFLASPPTPAYNRPSGLNSAHPLWGMPPAPTDYNEDIPACNGWWWQGPQSEGNPYVEEPTYLVKEMVSSLGQRGKWNYSLGLGLLIDGSIPPEFIPMADNMIKFLSWAGDSVYGTVGGAYGALVPGSWNNGAFGSITVACRNSSATGGSRDTGRVNYVHVTSAPAAAELHIPKRRSIDVKKVTDMASNREISFGQSHEKLWILTGDWTAVSEFGDKVFRIEGM